VQASAIFQRTDSGRTEIKNKMHGLTQSERLALIVIDGVTTYGNLREKLKGLSEERFDRALTKLLQKALIFEVLLPEANAVPEEFDASTVNNYLHQDPLDPVTIMSFDPEEEFDLDMQAESKARAQFQSAPPQPAVAGRTVKPTPATMPRVESVVSAHKPAEPVRRPLKIASVDFYVPLESAEDLRVQSVGIPTIKKSVAITQEPSSAPVSLEESVLFVTTPNRNIPWGQILIVVGLILVAASLAINFI
jgi:hypothetical protein